MVCARSSTLVGVPVQTLNTGASGGRVARIAGEQRGDDIGDEDEVAGLFAVAEHLDRRAAPTPLAEDRDHAGIGRARVLARAVDVEETQAGGRDAVHVAGHAGVQLAGVFVGAVGGERAAFGVLGDRHRPRSRHRPRPRTRRPPGPAAAAADRVEQGDGAGQVDAVRAEPVGDPAGDRGDGGEVETPSTPSTAARMASGSAMSASISVTPGGRLARDPVDRSSSTRTVSPRRPARRTDATR